MNAPTLPWLHYLPCSWAKSEVATKLQGVADQCEASKGFTKLTQLCRCLSTGFNYIKLTWHRVNKFVVATATQNVSCITCLSQNNKQPMSQVDDLSMQTQYQRTCCHETLRNGISIADSTINFRHHFSQGRVQSPPPFNLMDSISRSRPLESNAKATQKCS